MSSPAHTAVPADLPVDYVRSYHEDRTHLGLDKETPGARIRVAAVGHVVAHERPGDCTIAIIGLPDPRGFLARP